MAKYTINVPDDFAFGIAAAREKYNEDNAHVEDFVELTADRDYLEFVVVKAAESWHKAFGVPPSPEAYVQLEQENAALRAQLAAKD